MEQGMIIEGNWNSFINLEEEKLLLVKRGHIFSLFTPIILTIVLSVIFLSAFSFLFRYLIPSFPLFLISSLILISIAASLMAYSLVYWYFHLYILTNRKILEVWYTPLFSHIVNDIFLDKVNCTEIDLSSNGFFHELIDMGNISITFDRPTHQEEFILRNIKNSDEVVKFLTQNIMDGKRIRRDETIWLRPRARYIPKVAI